MFLRVRGLIGAVLLASFAFSMTGCAKRVESPDKAFEAQQKVVLTFSGDRTLQGRMQTASRVRYTDQGNVYRGRIRSLSEATIELENLVLLQSTGSVEQVTERLSDARVSIGENLPEVQLQRSEIERVDLVRFDGGRTLRNLSFWSFSGVVLALLLGERS